jgi:hypothetical protein
MIKEIVSQIKLFSKSEHLSLCQDICNQLESIHFEKYLDSSNPTFCISSLSELLNKSSLQLYQIGIESKALSKDICNIIGIEYNQTLSLRNKLSSILLALWMINSFLMMEISYSIVVLTDFKFHFIIKTFEEIYSIEVL